MRPSVMVVSARFYGEVADMLEAGARAALEEAGADVQVRRVPGAFEVPGAIARIHTALSPSIGGYVALGCVVRGETSHYDHICTESARALMDLSVRDRLAIGYGIITCESMEQAAERADPARRNKGAGAARACLAMMDVAARREPGSP